MARKRKRKSGLRLVKRPESPFYQIVGTVRGVFVKKSTGTTVEAMAEAMRLRTEESILLQAITGNDRDTVHFHRALNLYVDQNPDRNTRNVKLLNAHFAETLIKDINDEKVLEFVRLHYPKAKPASVDRLVYTPLIAMLHLAAKNKLCDAPKLTRPVVKKKMVEHAPAEWMKTFLDRCDNPRLAALVRVLTTTGCRATEACNIAWSHVNETTREIVLGKTKNGDPRVITVTQATLDAMLALREPDTPAGKRVFGMYDERSVNHALRRQAARHGWKYYSSHKLGRHAFAARLLARGHNLGEVAAAGGWSRASLRMLYSTYAHLEKSKLTANVLAAAEELEGT